MSRTLSLQERRDERNHRRTRSVGTFPTAASTSEAPSARRAARGHASRRSDPTPELPPLRLPGEVLGYPFTPISQSSTAARRLNFEHGTALPPPDERLGITLPRRAATWDVPLYEDGRRDTANTNANADGEGNGPNGGNTADQPSGFLGKLLELWGYAGQDTRARRALVSLVFGQLWWFSQVRLVFDTDMNCETRPRRYAQACC